MLSLSTQALTQVKSAFQYKIQLFAVQLVQFHFTFLQKN